MIRISDGSIQPFEREHIRIVRDKAPECTVLLKKDGSFPLPGPGTIAAYGSGVRKTIKGGTGSGDVNVRHYVSVEEGLENAGFTIVTKAWLDTYDQEIEKAHAAFIDGIRTEAREKGISPIMVGMGRTMSDPEYDIPIDAEADAAVYVLSRISGEGSDRRIDEGDILLSPTEIRDILACSAKYEKFMLVLNAGGMVDLTPVKDVKNILILSQLGTPTGDVLADLLIGKAYPSGKLAMTWAPIQDYPSTEDFGGTDDTPYHDGIYVGYRAFDLLDEKPLYAFGYGLGYTDFNVSLLDVSVSGTTVKTVIKVRNIGGFPGKEVVQLYLSSPAGRLPKEKKALRAFGKTAELQPGEEEDVVLEFDLRDQASFDTEKSAWILEKGEYTLLYGTASDKLSSAAVLKLEKEVTVKQVKPICPYDPVREIRLETVPVKAPDEARVIVLDPDAFITETTVYSATPALLPETEPFSFNEVKNGSRTLDEFLGGLTNEQLAYMSLGYFDGEYNPLSAVGASAVSLAGAAGETSGRLKSLDVPTLNMADGPAGIRVSTSYKVINGKILASSNPLAGLMEFLEPEQLQQMAAMIPKSTEEELTAPSYYMYCIAIPVGTALAQSWNPGVTEAMGDIVGEEMELFGVNIWLAPAMNIQRSPLCGRDFEYYSEDPYLTGIMASGITTGVQKHPGCAVTIKHFACNNQETNRYTSNSQVNERALREIYLKAFEIALRTASPYALMSSYNLVNGEHTCNSHDLLTAVLRDEWGYEGLVMTDWLVTDIIAGGTGHKNKYPAGSAAGCVKAGNDLTMPGVPSDFEDIMNALSDQTHPYAITRADLQQSAGRVLKMLMELWPSE